LGLIYEVGIIVMIIGERIKVVRKSEGLNQVEFARRINVSQGRLSEIESGTAMPSVETITLIINNFSCDVKWLLDVSGSHTSKGKFNHSNITAEEYELLSYFRILDSNNQKELFEIIKIKLKKWI
jgi:transcriptional regulator with XRE-family HTH domain